MDYKVTLQDLKDFIAALRSGKYKQAKGRLRVGRCFCAQGVFCDVVKSKVGGKWKSYPANDPTNPKLRRWKFITGNTISSYTYPYNWPFDTEPICDWNDEQDLTFSQIADKLEAKLPAEVIDNV